MALVERVGVAAAAKQLGLHDSQLYVWRSKARLHQEQGEAERQLAEQAEELAIRKKGCGVLREEPEVPEVKYAFMCQHSGIFRISSMCRVLEASRRGFYVWRQRQDHPSPQQQRQEQLDRQVAEAFEAGKKRSGALSLTLDLQEKGQHYNNRKTVAASLRRQGLRAKAARKFKATTNSKHDLPVAPNLL